MSTIKLVPQINHVSFEIDAWKVFIDDVSHGNFLSKDAAKRFIKGYYEHQKRNEKVREKREKLTEIYSEEDFK
jgi:hypothetical protein